MEQRPFYFRVFSIAEQRYDRDLIPSANVDTDGSFYFILAPDQFIIEEFTGFLDSNNKKIFEGDVVTVDGYDGVYAVAMSGGQWSVFTADRRKLSILSFNIRVVGTVHDKSLWITT
jgi:hypothetical protein